MDSKEMNDLDHKLFELHNGRLEIQDFMAELVLASVFIPIRDDSSKTGGLQDATDAKPLLIEVDTETGTDVVMPVFSNPSQSTDFLSDFPEYSGGLLVEFDWILNRARDNMGVSINPNLEFGIDLDPETIKQLVELKDILEQK